MKLQYRRALQGIIGLNTTPVLVFALTGDLESLAVPAKAGTHSIQILAFTMGWIPAFAGMTNSVGFEMLP